MGLSLAISSANSVTAKIAENRISDQYPRLWLRKTASRRALIGVSRRKRETGTRGANWPVGWMTGASTQISRRSKSTRGSIQV